MTDLPSPPPVVDRSLSRVQIACRATGLCAVLLGCGCFWFALSATQTPEEAEASLEWTEEAELRQLVVETTDPTGGAPVVTITDLMEPGNTIATEDDERGIVTAAQFEDHPSQTRAVQPAGFATNDLAADSPLPGAWLTGNIEEGNDETDAARDLGPQIPAWKRTVKSRKPPLHKSTAFSPR